MEVRQPRGAEPKGLDEAMRELASQSPSVNYTQPDWRVVDHVADITAMLIYPQQPPKSYL